LEDRDIDLMTERDWRIFRENYDIIVRGKRVPRPIRKWEDLDHIPEEVYRNLERLGY